MEQIGLTESNQPVPFYDEKLQKLLEKRDKLSIERDILMLTLEIKEIKNQLEDGDPHTKEAKS